MTAQLKEIRFVSTDRWGRPADPTAGFALRSHVRKVVERQKRSLPKSEVFKFIYQHPVAKQSRRLSKSLVPAPDRDGDELADRRTESLGVECQFVDVATELDYSETSSATPCINSMIVPTSPVCMHPFAVLAARHVAICPERLDGLFKDAAFRHAAEPLFDPSHVDASQSLIAVFPTCSDDAAFFNALVLSILLALCRGSLTSEVCRLKSTTLTCLQKSVDNHVRNQASISSAAIFVLRGSAYKWEDEATHSLHSRALADLVKMSCESLTPATLRGLFWQDLFASILLSIPRATSRLALSSRCSWQRTSASQIHNLPPGFERYRHLFPKEIINCVIDCTELRTQAQLNFHDTGKKFDRLDTMQADIESRLCDLALPCISYGAPANATRLAIFLVVYTTWMETWNSTLIPARVAQQLAGVLELSLLPAAGLDYNDDVWHSCRDLQLWLLRVGCSIAILDDGYTEGLSLRYSHLLEAFVEQVSRQTAFATFNSSPSLIKVSPAMLIRHAMDDFIYPPDCGRNCLQMEAWLGLLQAMGMDDGAMATEDSKCRTENCHTW